MANVLGPGKKYFAELRTDFLLLCSLITIKRVNSGGQWVGSWGWAQAQTGIAQPVTHAAIGSRACSELKRARG